MLYLIFGFKVYIPQLEEIDSKHFHTVFVTMKHCS